MFDPLVRGRAHLFPDGVRPPALVPVRLGLHRGPEAVDAGHRLPLLLGILRGGFRRGLRAAQDCHSDAGRANYR